MPDWCWPGLLYVVEVVVVVEVVAVGVVVGRQRVALIFVSPPGLPHVSCHDLNISDTYSTGIGSSVSYQ